MVKDILQFWKQGWHMRALFSVMGASLGYAYYITIGCDGGCPITGNPWSSAAYGAVVGLLAYPGPKQLRSDETNNKRKEAGEVS